MIADKVKLTRQGVIRVCKGKIRPGEDFSCCAIF